MIECTSIIHSRRNRASAFTLLEMLIVIMILALLISILMPMVSKARGQMKKLNCASNMRNMTIDFQLFADNLNEAGQGDSYKLGPNRFRINDFQDSIYGIDEFWDKGTANIGTLTSSSDSVLCPAGTKSLTKRKGYPCSKEAITPAAEVTIAVNMRLYRTVMNIRGKTLLSPSSITTVRSNILNHPYVPLFIDVDGKEASSRNIEPFYTAPPRQDSHDPYSSGKYWMPSTRHGSRINVAFIGGHVLSSEKPQEENWNWDYQASGGR